MVLPDNEAETAWDIESRSDEVTSIIPILTPSQVEWAVGVVSA